MSVVTLLSDFFYQMYSYREYLKQSVLRDLRTKYKRSFLGYIWTMAHPLGMMAVLAIVFSHITKTPTRDYAVFLFSGLLTWNYFNSTAMMSLGSIRINARLFSQVPVPKYIFVLSIAFSNLANYIFAIVPLIGIMLVLGRPIYPTVLFLPVALLPLFFLTVGVSLILAASNVFFNDIHHLSEVALSMLYFLSPILYDRTMLPASLIKWLELNPLFIQIEFIRGLFYSGELPAVQPFLANLGGSALILILGIAVFKKVEDKFLYYI